MHVLEHPGDSAEVRLNSNCRSSVSVSVLLEPPGAGNLCAGCAPATVNSSTRQTYLHDDRFQPDEADAGLPEPSQHGGVVRDLIGGPGLSIHEELARDPLRVR